MGLREQILSRSMKNPGFADAVGKVSDYVSTQPTLNYEQGTTTPGGVNAPSTASAPRIGVKMSESPNVKAPTTITSSSNNSVDSSNKTPWEGGSFYDWFGGEIKKGYDEDMKRIADEESRLKRNKATDRLNATREERLARQEENQRSMNSAKLKYWEAKEKGETDKAEYYSKLYELVSGGMTEKDARVALGLEPKTTYTVANKIDNSGKSSTTVTTRTGDIPSANEAINNANTNTATTTVTAGASGTKKSGTKKKTGTQSPNTKQSTNTNTKKHQNDPFG